MEHLNARNERQSNHQVTDSVFLLEGLSFFFGHLVTSLLRGLPHLSLVYTWGANICIVRYISALREKAAIKMRRAESIAVQPLSAIWPPQNRRFQPAT